MDALLGWVGLCALCYVGLTLVVCALSETLSWWLERELRDPEKRREVEAWLGSPDSHQYPYARFLYQRWLDGKG